MKLIIDIPEEMYNNYKEYVILNNDAGYPSLGHLYEIIGKGVPLPKGHGRLIDAEKIANEINTLKDNWNRYGNEYESGRYESYDYAVDEIEKAPTIIEADKEGE